MTYQEVKELLNRKKSTVVVDRAYAALKSCKNAGVVVTNDHKFLQRNHTAEHYQYCNNADVCANVGTVSYGRSYSYIFVFGFNE